MNITKLDCVKIDINFLDEPEKEDFLVYIEKKGIKHIPKMNYNESEFRLIAFYTKKDAKKILKFVKNYY